MPRLDTNTATLETLNTMLKMLEERREELNEKNNLSNEIDKTRNQLNELIQLTQQRIRDTPPKNYIGVLDFNATIVETSNELLITLNEIIEELNKANETKNELLDKRRKAFQRQEVIEKKTDRLIQHALKAKAMNSCNEAILRTQEQIQRAPEDDAAALGLMQCLAMLKKEREEIHNENTVRFIIKYTLITDVAMACGALIKLTQERIQCTPKNDTVSLNILKRCLATLNNKRNRLFTQTTEIKEIINGKMRKTVALAKIVKRPLDYSSLLDLQDRLKSPLIGLSQYQTIDRALDKIWKHLEKTLTLHAVRKEILYVSDQIENLVKNRHYDLVIKTIRKHSEKLKDLLKPVLPHQEIERLETLETQMLETTDIATLDHYIAEIKKFKNYLRSLESFGKLHYTSERAVLITLNYKITAARSFKMALENQSIPGLPCGFFAPQHNF